MSKYGNNIVMVDSTFGTNKYNFILITFYVIDEACFAIPILQIISTREVADIIKVCLTYLQDITNYKINPKWLMSDMAHSFNNACREVWGNQYSWVWCDYHVQKALNRSINKYTNDDEDYKDIREKIDKLSYCLTEQEFRSQLEETLIYLRENHAEFYEYFDKYYSKHCEKWGVVFRAKCPLNTNMKVEAGFGVLKNQVLERNTNNRMDFLTTKLIEFIDDIRININKSEHSKSLNFKSFKQKSIRKDHKKINDMNKLKYKIEKVGDKYSCGPYYIKENKEFICDDKCKLLCNECKICIHKYMCTCLSFRKKKNFCKHIYFSE
jgi:hypothetical protein